MSASIKVLVTGAAGQISYSLIYMICRGEMFGPDQKIILHLLEIPPVLHALDGIQMEIEDSCLDLVENVIKTSDESVAFADIDVAIMVGAMPRRDGMERSDLLKANAKIFENQGKSLDKYAKKSVKVLVVGNPANTNAFIMSSCAPSIPKANFSALTRLDHNRCIGLLAKKCQISPKDLRNVIIWGNHSSTQVPDVSQAIVKLQQGEKKVSEFLNDDTYLRNEFVKAIQTRGGSVIKARGASSAVSAAKAITDHMRDWWHGTKPGQFVSMAVYSEGAYGVTSNVFFSFPVTIVNKEWTIVKDIPIDAWAREMLEKTGQELDTERSTAMSFLTNC